MHKIDSDVVPEIPVQWQSLLGAEIEQPYFAQLVAALNERHDQAATIYPAKNKVFNALASTPPEKVRVVILGQDPYHGPQQAHGLAFSVSKGVKVPPSLKNMYKELVDDVGFMVPDHGCLHEWAAQGVFLLNSVLTVEKGLAASHSKLGWETFTDAVIAALNEKTEPLVFMVWGGYAQLKAKLIDRKKHLVLIAPHPSPLSCYRGFYGCQHFSKANEFLSQNGQQTIDWQLSK